jgi:hypothetical protein
MDPKKIKPEMPPFPIPQGELGSRALPGGVIEPVQPPVPTTLPPGEDFFKPVGRVSFPVRETPGAAPTRPVASNSTPAPLPFSAGTGMSPLPIPPAGTALPVPPVEGDGKLPLPPQP